MSQAIAFSRRVVDLKGSPIREILSVISRPGMISFAGGLPAPDTFPVLDTAHFPTAWLQYGPSEGEPELRVRIADDMRALGLVCTPEQVLILSGSQQGIDLVAKLFIDAGTCVAVESPTYLAALQVFRFFGAAFEQIAPNTVSAEQLRVSSPALVYVNPTFQNPTGRCYSTAERKALASACVAARVPLFEDEPYRDLAYDPCDRTPICAQLSGGTFIYQGSFSKTLAPGLRLGFLVASPDVFPHLVRLKQAADLHSNRLSQWLVLRELTNSARAERMADLVRGYRDKRDVFAVGLQQHLAPFADWEVPVGGLFFWLKLKRAVDTRALLPRAIARGLSFMPGELFFADPEQAAPTLRLNFSHARPDQIDAGLAILAELLAV